MTPRGPWTEELGPPVIVHLQRVLSRLKELF